jgi:enolase
VVRVLKVQSVRAWEILDSRGRPTVTVRARLSDGTEAEAQVPSGASTGRHEALELRDGDAARYGGLGVRKAAAHVNHELNRVLEGAAVDGVDGLMLEEDGTPDKSRLGANAILGVSCAVARAAATAEGVSLWQWLAARFGTRPRLPVPMVNILSGGLHAGRNMEFQDFLAIPHGFDSYREALEAVVAVHRAAGDLLAKTGHRLTGVADEGGWGPWLDSNETALRILTEAIETAGCRPEAEISIALDIASTHFYREGRYRLQTEGRELDSAGMTDLMDSWSCRYPVLSIEDALEEDDWAGWTGLTARLGGRLQLVGDDFFTTNPVRVREGIERKAANAVLVKMNQIGTLTETFEVLQLAREAGYRAVVSARSGETEDSFLADLAVASGAGQIKVGSVTRSERLSKYNRLLALEAEADLEWPGTGVFAGLTPPR